MKQIVDKLNKIAQAIDESVELPTSDLIIDSLDAITKAYGGTPNDSNLIVDKLEDIASVAHSGITPTGNIAITENTAEGEPLNISQYATATVNVPAPAPERHYVIPEGTYTSIVQGGLSGVYLPNTYFFAPEIVFNIDGVEHILKGASAKSLRFGVEAVFNEENNALIEIVQSYMGMSGALIPTTDTESTEHTISAYYVGEKKYWQIITVDANSSAQFIQYETLWGGDLDDRLVSEVVRITSGNYSRPILAYPRTNAIIYCCYSNGEASTIICSTYSSPTDGYYNIPSDENNLAFITWAEEIPQ